MPAAAEVQRMFGDIADRYDLLNHVLSLGVDRGWRRRSCDELRVTKGETAADLCCGTGDLSLCLAARGARVVGIDFSPHMLRLAARKGLRELAGADCLRLPFTDGRFDIVTMAFGARNLEDLHAGLREMLRVLRPGGRLGVLEFGSPAGRLFRRLYRLYLRSVVPAVGAAISLRASAYAYLASSIQSFPDQHRMQEILRDAGFVQVRHVDFAGGIAALYLGERPAVSRPSPSLEPLSAGAIGSPPDRR